MRKYLIAVVGSVAILASPAPAHAWGFEAHAFIMARAIELLPWRTAEVVGWLRRAFEQFPVKRVERRRTR